MNRIIVCVLLSLFGSAMLSAQVKLLPIFSDNMVLQQRVKAPIWGETLPNKTVEIITSWNKKKYTALADEKGKWIVKVDTPSVETVPDVAVRVHHQKRNRKCPALAEQFLF